MTAIVGKENTHNFRLVMLRSALRMELRGMRMTRKTRSAYAIVKSEFKLKGNKQKVYDEFCKILEDKGL
jgi:hypothetical protein